jgi:hypothetical protein
MVKQLGLEGSQWGYLCDGRQRPGRNKPERPACFILSLDSHFFDDGRFMV